MTLIPGPPQVYTADSSAPVASPYWLGMGGAWVHLEGVTPGVSRTKDRPRSSLVTVDGARWAQQAPRGPRSWELSWRFESPAATAAVSVAAEAHGDVWLHDEAAAAANMLSPRDCHGAGEMLLCSGVPLGALPVGSVVTARVRGGVPTYLAAWSSLPAASALLSVTYPGGVATLAADPEAPGAQRAALGFIASEDGPVSIEVVGTPVSGLQMTEGALPSVWLAGERTPCRVEVHDPEQTALMVRGAARTVTADYSVTVEEVG
jgi:hypothetical protein